MNRTAEEVENDPDSQAIREALMKQAEINEYLHPFYHRRPGESWEDREKRMNEYLKMPREELLRLAKEYQQSSSPGK